MALILSAASGNFNAGATWVGGIVPGAADEARASTTHTVTITANVTCTELSNAGTGLFILNSGVTLTANVTHKSATVNVNCLQFTAASPATATIVGNITGGSVASTTVYGAVNNTSSGALTITGSVTGGSASLAIGANNNGTGTITITGNVLAGSASLAIGANNNGNGSLIVVGNVTGGSAADARGVGGGLNGIVQITGNVTGGTNASAHGMTNVSTGPVTITGNITASTGAGVTNSSTATLTISGGTYTASTVANAVISTNASSVVRASGSFIYASNGFVPINTPKFILLSTPTLAKTRYALNGSTTYVDMFTADNSLGQAAITDVRFGTVYASGALTGVAYIPAASSVGFGVPVDNTTGTAALTPASVWDHLLSAITASSTIGTLLKTNIDATISSRSTLTAANVRTELTPELTEITEVHAIHGLDIANALTVTPTLRSAGAITQAITGDGTTSTIVTRV
jgi:hypothetical protein